MPTAVVKTKWTCYRKVTIGGKVVAERIRGLQYTKFFMQSRLQLIRSAIMTP